MIAYVTGELTEIEDKTIVVEAYGVGYEIMVTDRVIKALPAIGGIVKIYTYQNVKEDALDLFGFIDKDDLRVFKLLLQVNGIGPKGALGILSSVSADDLRIAVISSDVKTIQKIPGIGAKTAQRLIIELKDKISATEVIEKGLDSGTADIMGAKDEAVEALTALGYSASESLKAVNSVYIDNMDSEELLKKALKQMAFM